jgi:predicted RNase H-like HicB family nuclease
VKNQFTAIVVPSEEGGYGAFCPEVPPANGQGETVEEAIADLASAIEFVLEGEAGVDLPGRG